MLNMDFSAAVTLDTRSMDWVASPHPDVWRKPLAREEAERGHATSIVRYDPGASFHAHDHPGGEEILVLDGTFSDATGDFHAGTYFRNPIGFRHAPFSKAGCLILVKLHQFQEDDTARVVLQTDSLPWQERGDGTGIKALHSHHPERVQMVSMSRDSSFRVDGHGGSELLILSGTVADEDGVYAAGTWLRRPPGASLTLKARDAAHFWLKTGHLPG